MDRPKSQPFDRMDPNLIKFRSLTTHHFPGNCTLFIDFRYLRVHFSEIASRLFLEEFEIVR
jgi:hypothetical protein